MFRCTKRPYPTVKVRDGTKIALVSFVRGGVLDPKEAAPRVGVRMEVLVETLRSLPEYGVTIFAEGEEQECSAGTGGADLSAAAATPPPTAEEGAAEGPAPSSPLACPHCGREDFRGRRGLARHISAMHPEAGG